MGRGIGQCAYIPGPVQQDVFESLGPERYLKLPKAGTNHRRVEFRKETVADLIGHGDTKSIDIFWLRPEFNYNNYQRWVDY